jgi:hypothetical protein
MTRYFALQSLIFMMGYVMVFARIASRRRATRVLLNALSC